MQPAVNSTNEPLDLMKIETKRGEENLKGFTVVLDNLLTNEVDNEDVECLVDSFLDQLGFPDG